MSGRLTTLLFAFAAAFRLCGTTYYVATTGSDTNPGTFASPWRTIQKSANTLTPGDTALIRGGTYNEAVTFHVSGSAGGGRVTFQNYPGEQPVIDGTGLAIPQLVYAAGLLEFTNGGYITVQGLEIQNYQTSSVSLVPAGIDIAGAPHDLSFISNRIHNVANFNGTSSANAYGIAVHGTVPQVISNLVFRSNEIYSNTLGQSETFSLDGNVSGFEISSNLVHDNNNIGIGFIGWEKVCSDTNQDYARNGVCRGNQVWNISSATNPGYPTNDYSADGIYSDGGSNVVIELNNVHHCDLGVEMASENKGHATDSCICRDNLIWSNNTTGISIGGYSTAVGKTLRCSVTHNTLYQNDSRKSGTGEIELQFAPISNSITHNILVANAQNLFIGNQFVSNSANVIDWNLYYSPGGTNGSNWEWKKTSYGSFAAWKTATSNDTHSLFADPRLASPVSDFHLFTNSPARDAGDPAFVAASGETDFASQPRVRGPRTDIGAYEYPLAPIFNLALGDGAVLLTVTGTPGETFVWQQSTTLLS